MYDAVTLLLRFFLCFLCASFGRRFAEGIMFSTCPSVRPCVRACVLMCVPGRDILRLTSTSSLDIFVVFNFYLVYDVIVN